jgi:hypothetical protein
MDHINYIQQARTDLAGLRRYSISMLEEDGQIELGPFKNDARKWIKTQTKNSVPKKSRATDLLQILNYEEAKITLFIAMVLSAPNAARTILYAQDQEAL